MTIEETVKSWLQDRYVEEILVQATVVSLSLCYRNVDSAPIPEMRLCLYTSVSLSNNSSSIKISSPSLDPGIVEKAATVAACSLILGTTITDIQLDPNGILILGFDNSLSLTVSNTSDSIEYSWVICESDYSDRYPKFEVFCSNLGILDRYKIG